MTPHPDPHPLAGQSVELNDTAKDPVQGAVMPGAEYRIEDWWDRLGGGSWMFADGNHAALHYAVRVASNGLPLDDEVGYLGHIVHVSELGPVMPWTPREGAR
jgi:hypothetical protein